MATESLLLRSTALSSPSSRSPESPRNPWLHYKKRMTNFPTLNKIHLETLSFVASLSPPVTVVIAKETRFPASPCRKRNYHSRARSWFRKSENFFFFFFLTENPTPRAATSLFASQGEGGVFRAFAARGGGDVTALWRAARDQTHPGHSQ